MCNRVLILVVVDDGLVRNVDRNTGVIDYTS